MVAIGPLRGFRITDKGTHGFLNPWKNLLDNRDLGEDFHDCPKGPSWNRLYKESIEGKVDTSSAYLQVSTTEFGCCYSLYDLTLKEPHF